MQKHHPRVNAPIPCFAAGKSAVRAEGVLRAAGVGYLEGVG